MSHGNRYLRDTTARTLGDTIRNKAALVPICQRCKHRGLMFPAMLAEKLGAEFQVREVQPLLRCEGCGGRGTANLYEATR